MSLTKIQRQERDKRNRNRLKMCGQLTPPGTQPRVYRPCGEPIFRPIQRELGLGDIMARLNLLLTPWWMRKRKEAERAQNEKLRQTN